jgi:pimeloyl-ACP methyl ester carboxylesterase
MHGRSAPQTTAPHRRTHILGVVLVALLALLAAACSQTATTASGPKSVGQANPTKTVARPSTPVDELVAVNGSQLHVQCTGSGTTTVVLIAGFGGTGESWEAVAPTIAARTRVCSYSRFGNGTSDPPPTKQTFATEAKDLRSALHSIDEAGPYVVVGHSFGGAEAVTFASLFPAEVRGLMLVDASPTNWLTATCAVPDNGSTTAGVFRDNCASMSSAKNPERLDGPTAFAEVAKIKSLGTVPLIVTTATRHAYADLAPDAEAQLNQVWDAGQQHWLSLSSNERLVPVENTSHNIQLDRPEVVIEQIRRLLP